MMGRIPYDGFRSVASEAFRLGPVYRGIRSERFARSGGRRPPDAPTVKTLPCDGSGMVASDEARGRERGTRSFGGQEPL
jgi:hypothetical protein